jgi:hypothetical protein
MPKISTGMSIASTWTWAWLGRTFPARSWKRGHGVEVAERAVGDAAEHAEAAMHGRVDLAPECAEAQLRVDVRMTVMAGWGRRLQIL